MGIYARTSMIKMKVLNFFMDYSCNQGKMSIDEKIFYMHI